MWFSISSVSRLKTLMACWGEAHASKGERGWISQAFTEEEDAEMLRTLFMNRGSHILTSPATLHETMSRVWLWICIKTFTTQLVCSFNV